VVDKRNVNITHLLIETETVTAIPSGRYFTKVLPERRKTW
jgi:hypothetical protein